MAGMKKRRIKFALELRDREQARTMEDLQQYFDINKIIGYFQDGKLLSWLEDRFYDDEADAIKKLSGDEKDLDKRLCHIFHVDYSIFDDVEDAETIAWRKERLERLKQFTANPLILDNVDFVAFNQDDLEEIIHKEDTDTVYLCQNKFLFPSGILKKGSMHYIGVGKNVEVVIKSSEEIDFDEKRIIFENIKLGGNYRRLSGMKKASDEENDISYMTKEVEWPIDYEASERSPEELLKLGRKATKAGAGKHAVEYYQIIINKYEDEVDDGIVIAALKELADIYYKGELVKRNCERAFSLYRKAASKNDVEAMIWIGLLYEGGLGVTMNKSKAVEWYTLAANAGDVCGMLTLGMMYRNGEGVEKDWKIASEWYRKASENDDSKDIAMLALGEMYFKGGHGLEKNYAKALYWFRHTTHEGDDWYLDKQFLAEFIYLIQKSRTPFYISDGSGFFSFSSCDFLQDSTLESSNPKTHDIFEGIDLLGQSEILICVLEIRHPLSCDGIAFTDQVMYVKGNVYIPYTSIMDVSVSGRRLTVSTKNKKWDIDCEMFNPAAIKLFLQIAAGLSRNLTAEENKIMCEIYPA